LAVGACLVFAGGLGNGFAAEDYDWLIASSLDGPLLLRLIARSARLRPLSLLLGWLGYRVWGTDPWVWHGLILALHILCSLGVFSLTKQLLRKTNIALLATALFSVYPRHHQAVLWLAANQFVLSGVGVLFTLVLHVRYLRTGKLRFYLLTWALAVGALAAQEISAVVFPLMFLTEVLIRAEEGSGNSLRQVLLSPRTYLKYAPVLLFLTLFLALTFGGDRSFKLRSAVVDPRAEMETYHFVGLDGELVRTFAAYGVYLVFPQIPLRTLDVSGYAIALTLVVVAGLSAVFVLGGRFERYCLLWMAGTLLPFVLFVPFGNADRYFYLPAVGYSMLLATLAHRLWRFLRGRWGRVARVAAMGVLVLYLASAVVLTQQRIAEWRRAGDMVEEVLLQVRELYPEVPRESRMFFVGLPGWYGQAYVFQGGGIGGAVRMAYQDLRIKVYRSMDPELARWLAAQEEGERTPGQYVFLYEGGEIRDVSARVRDFEDFYESWWWYP
jgi:hypothetical protein